MTSSMSDDLKVDFSGRLEAVHRDGRIGGVEPHARPFSYGQVYGGLAGIGHWDQHYGGWDEYGHPCSERNPWRIRNVAEPKGLISSETLSDDLAKRMEALVRDMAKLAGGATYSHLQTEARAIVAMLPEPVDADLVEAREIAVKQLTCWGQSEALLRNIIAGDNDHYPEVRIALAAIRRGRALERDSREG